MEGLRSSHFKADIIRGQAKVIRCYNCQEEGHMGRQCTKPKRPRNSAWFKEKAMLAEALESGVEIPTPPSFQIDDVDAFDSNCDEAPSASAVLMAKLSSYDSEILSEIMSLEEMMESSLIRLLSKSSKTKSWLWHQRLSHLNFGDINDLAKQGKSKKHTYKTKSDDSIQEKLYLLHMDLYGPMRIESINGKKYILVIVDDYSRFTWLKPKADTGILVGYAPAKKAYRISNKRTRLIMETIHVEFDELTTMASKQFDSGPELQLMTPVTISSGLMQNAPFSTPYVPPTKNDWDILFQPMFDEFFNPPSSVVSLVSAAAAPRPINPTGVEEHLQQAPFTDDPFLDILTLEPSSQESTSIVQPTNPPFEHIRKWTKIHSLENVIGNPSRPVSTCKQLETNAMRCFFDAFLTSIKPKNFKEVLLGSS
ncbi:integrase, catalytic region, zinc finger, CCHC-type containing protein [Tanacetum coccineum]